jgi:hypothetical protein
MSQENRAHKQNMGERIGAYGACQACQGRHRAHTCSTKGNRNRKSSLLSSPSIETQLYLKVDDPEKWASPPKATFSCQRHHSILLPKHAFSNEDRVITKCVSCSLKRKICREEFGWHEGFQCDCARTVTQETPRKHVRIDLPESSQSLQKISRFPRQVHQWTISDAMIALENIPRTFKPTENHDSVVAQKLMNVMWDDLLDFALVQPSTGETLGHVASS